MPQPALLSRPYDDDYDAPPQEFGPHRVQEALNTIAGGLEQKANDQRSRKKSLEQRWIDDLRQYHGRYNAFTEANLRNENPPKSRVFTNITRNKTHAWESRLGDMLFPTDDKNWGIQPTPVPELTDAAERAVEELEAIAQQATEASAQAAQGDPNAQAQVAELEAQAKTVEAGAETIRAQMDEAKRRCKLMEALIEDQLRETSYNIRSRECITDMVRIGTQVKKGPIVGERRRGRWQAQDVMGPDGQPTGEKTYAMHSSPDPRPEFTRVDPWMLFPEMSARTMEECEFSFELHPLTAKALRALAKRDDFNADAIREILTDKPRQGMPDWWPLLREISDGDMSSVEARYHVWEYHGSLEEDDVRNLILAFGNQEWLDGFEDDPLRELNVIVWFCQGHVIKFGPHPLESGESLYSVTPFEKDDTSMFGYGVPYMLRNAQAVINGASRMMMNNAALSSAPQIIMNQKKIDPADGQWALTAGKVWLAKEGLSTGERAFDQFEIASRQAELQAIIALWRQFADEETEMPLIATGEQAAHITTTAQGMSILMNSANVVFRRVVKNYDDCDTTPNIRRMYDWNMQHSSREDAKGDMEVDARGSSALLIRELQSQNMLNLLAIGSRDPELAPYMKKVGVLRAVAQTMSIRADDIILSEEEVEQNKAEQAKNAEPPIEIQVEQMRQEGQMKFEQLRHQNAMQEAEAARETEMMKVAQTSNMALEGHQVEMHEGREERASDERKLAAEIAMTPADTKGGGGSV